MHGDRRNYVTALLTLDPEPRWRLGGRARPRGPGAGELARLPEVKAARAAAVDQLNAALPRFATVKRFTVLAREFAEAEGEVTPSQKLKRKVIEQRYRAELDAMYREGVTL